MYEEFFNYIATRIISYFEQECDNLHDGDRFCFKLDNGELVEQVNDALYDITLKKDIQGKFSYQEKYHTFTVKLTNKEIIIAAQVNGMTDDFFATLRNIPLSINKNPILMITCAPIDTISSATRDLSAKGMPFCADELLKTIEQNIEEAQLSAADHVLLMHELKRKKSDRFADRKSLFEYKGLLTSVCTGRVSEESWIDFRLLPDANGLALKSDPKKQEQQIDENHRDFEMIDKIFKFGNLRDGLDSSFDSSFISELENKKRQGINWFENLTYADVMRSKAKKEKKQNTPLIIDNDSIVAYCGSPIEYEFQQDQKLFIRDGGTTKAKQREKHILIYNPEKKETVTIAVPFNIAVRKDLIMVKDSNKICRRSGIAGIQRSLRKYAFSQLSELIGNPDERNFGKELESCHLNEFELMMEIDKDTLSKGETQVFVMSLYWAMMQQCKCELPFIIDTPFARIDTDHRANIVEQFFKRLPGQLFVLSTNEEIGSKHMLALHDQTSNIFLLEYGDDKCTHIMNNQYFEV